MKKLFIILGLVVAANSFADEFAVASIAMPSGVAGAAPASGTNNICQEHPSLPECN